MCVGVYVRIRIRVFIPACGHACLLNCNIITKIRMKNAKCSVLNKWLNLFQFVPEQAFHFHALSSTGTTHSSTLFAVTVSKKMRMGFASVSDNLCSFQIGYDKPLR